MKIKIQLYAIFFFFFHIGASKKIGSRVSIILFRALHAHNIGTFQYVLLVPRQYNTTINDMTAVGIGIRIEMLRCIIQKKY